MSHIKVHKSLVLECLYELSNISFQQRVWVVGVPSIVSGFNDTIASLFDDSLLGDALENNKVTFTIELDHTLRILNKKVKSTPYNIADKDLIKLPVWEEILELSGELYKSILKISDDPEQFFYVSD